MKRGGPIKSLTIFPGTNYGHVEFQSVDSAMRLMKVVDKSNDDNQDS